MITFYFSLHSFSLSLLTILFEWQCIGTVGLEHDPILIYSPDYASLAFQSVDVTEAFCGISDPLAGIYINVGTNEAKYRFQRGSDEIIYDGGLWKIGDSTTGSYSFTTTQTHTTDTVLPPEYTAWSITFGAQDLYTECLDITSF